MFLFKNTKSLVKRIGMNMAVYGFAGVFVSMMLSLFLSEMIANYVYILTAITSFAAIVGSIISIVSFLLELFSHAKGARTQTIDKEAIKERKKCSRCGDGFSKIEMFNNKPYCYICSAYYSSNFNVTDGQLIDKKTGAALIKEVVLLARPLHACRGSAEPTDFVINLFADKVEILWGIGWQGGTSHADGTKGIEVLEANYFEKNTIDDFVALLNKKHWGKDFVKWFNIKENDKIISLFNPLNSVIYKMIRFLSYKNYDIAFADGEMNIVKHSDDPWNRFNKFIAKDNGIYNFIEVHMGGYNLTKRLSCSNYETASFVLLTIFFARVLSLEKVVDSNTQTILDSIKEHIDYALKNTSDYDRGQCFIDEILDIIK